MFKEILFGCILTVCTFLCFMEVTKESKMKIESFTYDFYGECDILYLVIRNNKYEVWSEVEGLLAKPKDLDAALREISHVLPCKERFDPVHY